MATRMQQRRGTAAQWISTNAGAGPVLNAGEIGWESDTNRFKIGDGVNNWSNLDYFADINSTVNPSFGTSIVFEGATADSYETTLQVTDPTADRTITLPDSSGTIALTSDIAELSQDAIDAALTAGTGIIKTYNDSANTLTLAVDTTAIQEKVSGVSNTEIGYLDGVTSSIQTQLDAKAPLSSPTFTGTLNAADITLSGNLTVNGTTTNINSTNLVVEDKNIIFGDTATPTDASADGGGITLKGTTDKTLNWVDSTDSWTSSENINLASGKTYFKNGTDIKDVSETLTNKTINATSNTITITSANVSDFNEAAQDAIGNSLGSGLSYNDSTGAVSVDTTTIQARVSGVSDTEIGYLDGVTSAIQTQLDSKAASADITELAQDAVNTALTAGTGITKTYNDSANTITVAVDTTAIQARVSGVSDTEIGYLDGVTSSIQTQLDAKSTASKTETLSNKSISLTSNTLTGTTAEFNTALSDSNFVTTGDTGTVTSTMIADGTIVNADINTSAAIALSKLATDPLARANHTGTQTASTISDFDTQVRTSKVTDLAAPISSFSMNSQKITSLATPTSDADAATKAYVDAATAGLNVHASVQAATTANITLASAIENGDTLDGVTLATGNRVLVKNQTDKTENGVYVVKASGAPDRATDYDSTPEVDAGDFIFVESGTANGKTGWVQTNVITTIGSDNIEFTQFSGVGTYTAGNGLTLTGSSFAIDTAVTQTRVSGVSDTEIGYLDGVTSAIQTQLDSKLASSTAASTYAPLSSPTFTGTVTIPNGAGLGTPTTLTLTNATGLPVSTGISGLGTGIATALAVNTGSAGAPVLFNGALGTPSSGTLTNATGLPISGLTSSTTTALGVGSIELGHATDTTIARGSAGVVTIEGVNVVTTSSTDTLTNKTLSSAVATTALTLNATAELRLADTDSTHYVGFKAPGTVSTNRIWTLPSADGTANQVLSTNGSGTLSWSTAGGGAAFSEFMLIGA